MRRPRRRPVQGAARTARPTIVTDTIETFTETGIRLTSGRVLEADIVVTATGLKLKPFGGIAPTVDGDDGRRSAETSGLQGAMLSGVPNFAVSIGYTNASWTLQAPTWSRSTSAGSSTTSTSAGLRSVVPPADDEVGQAPFMDFRPGYVLRSLDELPKQGDREPWKLRQNYLHDLRTIRRLPIDDGVLTFA